MWILLAVPIAVIITLLSQNREKLEKDDKEEKEDMKNKKSKSDKPDRNYTIKREVKTKIVNNK